MSRTLDGAYSISPDGTGTISLTDAPGDLAFSFVTTDDGSGLLLPQATLSPAATCRLEAPAGNRSVAKGDAE